MKKKYPTILLIGIFSLATALIWIASDVLRSFFFQKPAVIVPNEILAPVNPALDIKTLDNVNAALFFDPQQITIAPSPTVSPSESPSPTAKPTPVASPSPLVSPSPGSTP